MGRRNFRGPVITLADSCEANYLVIVICGRCETRRQMHPYKLLAGHDALLHAKLGTFMPGFFCKTCRRSVSATITCTYRHPGEM